MGVIADLLVRWGTAMGGRLGEVHLPGEEPRPNTEQGWRSTPEKALEYLYRMMWVDSELRATILDIRRMHRLDPRVKKVHKRTAAAAIKGGLRLKTGKTGNTRLTRAWQDFERRLRLNRREKLESDARGMMMEGNLPMQWVLGADRRVVAAIRMPSETILPKVGANGTFLDPMTAYEQYDVATGSRLAVFPLWQLSLGRLTPDNYDDQGCMGRPYLDASRSVWQKLAMTEEDLVLRRRMRAPLRLAHVLEGATPEEMDAYRAEVEQDQAHGITTDYYMNRKGSVTPVQGDTNLEQIADVVHLLDTFFAGAPAPKGLFGYTKDLARDILEDLKRDFFDEIDSLQDTLSYVYQLGFELDLLLKGINPMDAGFEVVFAERRTETPNQAADRALKYQAIGLSGQTVMETAGVDPAIEMERLDHESRDRDPYPEPHRIGPSAGAPRVSITPGNARKGESATDIRSGGGE